MNSRPMRVLFDAMHHGKYEFDEFVSCDVESHYEPVPWSGRVIYKPSKTLKAFHRFLNSFLLEHLPTNERVAYAYRKGTNPHHALIPHAGSRAFYQTDLTKFFDSITSPLIRRVISEGATPISDLLSYIDRTLELVTVEGRLPIGFSTSPMISNACLKQFDDAFEAMCNQQGLIYSRYADDIIVSCQHRQSLANIQETLTELIREHLGPEFSINRSKSKLTTVGRKVKALGMVILPSGQISVDMNIKKKVESQLYFFIKDRARLLAIFNNDMESGLQQLAGHVSHINSADPTYLEKLRRKYGTTVIDSFLHRSAK
jgi:RNA-directed DNA polymerase